MFYYFLFKYILQTQFEEQKLKTFRILFVILYRIFGIFLPLRWMISYSSVFFNPGELSIDARG